jgi:hypothetical protein
MIASLAFASCTPSQTRAAFLIDDHCRKEKIRAGILGVES